MKLLTDTQRNTYFLLFCIPLRTIIALIPLYIQKHLLPYYGVIVGIIGLCFVYLYISNSRLNAPEGGGITWWAKHRLIHGALFLTSAIYLFQKERMAYMPLSIDVILGVLLFLMKE
jgi:hypothetical protein